MMAKCKAIFGAIFDDLAIAACQVKNAKSFLFL
jgi:hypothetical protein